MRKNENILNHAGRVIFILFFFAVISAFTGKNSKHTYSSYADKISVLNPAKAIIIPVRLHFTFDNYFNFLPEENFKVSVVNSSLIHDGYNFLQKINTIDLVQLL